MSSMRLATAVGIFCACVIQGIVALPAGPQLEIEILKTPQKCKQVSFYNDVLTVHYTGRFFNGTIFDSSLRRASPFHFTLGTSSVLPGFQLGVLGMCVGERRRLHIPPQLAYGRKGVGDVIAPGTPLLYEVALVDLKKKGVGKRKFEPRTEGPYVAVSTLVRVPVCTRRVTKGDQVKVHYAGYLNNSRKFDSSIDRGEPFQFVMGKGVVIPGWEVGLLGMCVGERRRLLVPPHLGYGPKGVDDVIPPDSSLVFDVQLLDIA